MCAAGARALGARARALGTLTRLSAAGAGVPAPRVGARARALGTLTHLSAAGGVTAPLMVDVSAKPVTARRARAEATLLVRAAPPASWWPADAAAEAALIATVVVAGVGAAKRAASLIPLCHALPLDGARVDVARPAAAGGGATAVRVTVSVATAARTGVEMEALAGAAVAALALYDMLKAAVPPGSMEVAAVRLLGKAGGKRDFGDAGAA